MTDPLSVAAIGTAGYVAHRLFGKTLEEMGSDINEFYRKGRDRILIKAAEKITDPEDGKIANLRVARDVLWNGVVTESEVCAEYFGGVLASSRTSEGIDDATIQYVDVIKALSSSQLHLHYCVYRELQRLLLTQNVEINLGLVPELSKIRLYGFPMDTKKLGINLDLDIPVLARNCLISDHYEKNDFELESGKVVSYFFVKPTVFGVTMYCAAFNRLNDWRKFHNTDYGVFPNVKSFTIAARTLEGLYRQINLTVPDHIVKKFRHHEKYVEPALPD